MLVATERVANTLHNQIINDAGRFHTGEALVEAEMAVGESFVIEAERFHRGGVEVVN